MVQVPKEVELSFQVVQERVRDELDMRPLNYRPLRIRRRYCPFLMKKHVLVGSLMRPPTPWKSRPNSLADECVQASLNFG